MPFCPQCREEYRDGFEICAECGALLLETLPPRFESPDDPAVWPLAEDGKPAAAKLLLGSLSRMDAELKATLLEAFGVPARIEASALNDRFTSVLFGNYVLSVDLLVPEEHLDEARALLALGAEEGFED